MPLDVASVFGTFNRLLLLQECVESIRRSAGDLSQEIIVADGGSTDGTVAYLEAQPDVVLIHGDLSGACPNFNLGFARAIEDEAQFINVFNDDLVFCGPEPAIVKAGDLMFQNPQIGGVVWESDHHRDAAGNRSFGFETWRGWPYLNQGLVRREALMAVARFLGDPSGKAFWGNTHKTYAADTEAGISLWRLGYIVHCGAGLRVHDHEHQDAMKQKNRDEYTTGELFGRRFPAGSAEYNRDDAVRCGGFVR